MFLSMIWVRGSGAPSVNLQMTLRVLICWRAARLCREAGSMGHSQLDEVQQDEALGSQQPWAVIQAWGRVAGKMPG